MSAYVATGTEEGNQEARLHFLVWIKDSPGFTDRKKVNLQMDVGQKHRWCICDKECSAGGHTPIEMEMQVLMEAADVKDVADLLVADSESTIRQARNPNSFTKLVAEWHEFRSHTYTELPWNRFMDGARGGEAAFAKHE